MLPIPVLSYTGAFMNALVESENAYKMPVFADACQKWGGLPIDPNHACASGAVRLAGFADWISAGAYIYSPGDLLMSAAEWYALAALALLFFRIFVTIHRNRKQVVTLAEGDQNENA